MARRDAADDCLFCAPNPCMCNARKKAPARAPRKTVQSTPVTPSVSAATIEPPKATSLPPAVDQPAATRPRAGGLRAVRSLAPKIERPTVTKAVRQEAEREDEMTAAIRLIAEAGLIDAAELLRHRADLRMTDHDFGELLLKVRGT